MSVPLVGPETLQASVTQRRGPALRVHILHVAKDLFLETGFDRASMDVVARRAATSKRSLYAHYESKDKLFDAVLELIRDLYLGTLKTPDAYSDDEQEAVVLFCGRFQQLMSWESQIRTCRLVISEAERLPASAHSYFSAVFESTAGRLGDHLQRCGFRETTAQATGKDLLSRAAFSRLFSNLLNGDAVIRGIEPPDESLLRSHVDLDAIRLMVAEVWVH